MFTFKKTLLMAFLAGPHDVTLLDPDVFFYVCTWEDVIQVEKVTPDAKLSRAETSSSMGSASDESVVQNLIGKLEAAERSLDMLDYVLLLGSRSLKPD